MKVMYPAFSGCRIPAAIVDSRPEIPLDRLADLDILILDLIAERDQSRPGGIGSRIGRRLTREPIERDDRSVLRDRDDDVRLHLPHVDVQHDAGEDPSIHGLGHAGFGGIVLSIGRASDYRPKWSVLDRRIVLRL